MKFVKMHGAGNDYVYIDCFRQKIEDPESLAREVSDRNFGIGGDGMILIEPSNGPTAIRRPSVATTSASAMFSVYVSPESRR